MTTDRRIKNGKWEARVTVGTNPGTGKPPRRSIYGDTQAEVRKQMTAILRELDKGTSQEPEKVTVNVYAHTSEQMMKDTAARMQNYYDGLALGGKKPRRGNGRGKNNSAHN